ncbi:MAG: glycosyltransferase family 39 protein, partial [Nitrospinales bacterium]
MTVRVIYFYQFQENPFFDHVPKAWDQTVYHEGAAAFAQGDLLAVAPDQLNLFSPLYQYFLGIVYGLFGVDLKAVWAVQFLLGTCSTWLVYRIAVHYIGPAASFTAGLLFTFYGTNWLYEGALYRATLITSLELVSCLLLIRFAHRPGYLRAVWSAVSLSLFMQCRTNHLLLVPFALVYLWKHVFSKRENGKTLLSAYLAVFIAVSIPLLVWVHEVHGKWNFYDQTGPENLLLANTPDYPGRGYQLTEIYSEALEKLPLKTLPIMRLVVQTAWENPLDFLSIYLRKTYYYFNNYEIPNTQNFYLFQEFSPILKWGAVPFAAIGASGLMGFVLLRKHRKSWTLPHAYGLGIFLMFLPFLVLSRYRLSLVPFLCIFAAYTLSTLCRKAREKNWTQVSILVICFLVLGLAEKTDPLPEGKVRIIDYANLGSAFLYNADPEDDFKGYEYYKRAWELSRSLEYKLRQPAVVRGLFHGYYYRQAQQFLEKGDVENEIGALKKALFFDYSSSPTHDLYARALFQKKNLREALVEALQAVVLQPGSPSSHLLLGALYNQSSKPLWALYHWQKTQELIDGPEKESLAVEIKRFRAQLKNAGVVNASLSAGGMEETRKLLRSQAQAPVDFAFDLTLPAVFSESTGKAEQYMINLYQQ